jgi:hypothetical protein
MSLRNTLNVDYLEASLLHHAVQLELGSAQLKS